MANETDDFFGNQTDSATLNPAPEEEDPEEELRWACGNNTEPMSAAGKLALLAFVAIPVLGFLFVYFVWIPYQNKFGNKDNQNNSHHHNRPPPTTTPVAANSIPVVEIAPVPVAAARPITTDSTRAEAAVAPVVEIDAAPVRI